MLARGEITDEEMVELIASSAPSTGYCNTMGTATTMNSLAEALGLQLPGSAAPGEALQADLQLATPQAHGASVQGHVLDLEGFHVPEPENLLSLFLESPLDVFESQ